MKSKPGIKSSKPAPGSSWILAAGGLALLSALAVALCWRQGWLLYYGDATRENDRGSVWGWGQKGRPVVLMELYQNTTDRTRWVYAICNTSGRKVRARRGSDSWWRFRGIGSCGL